jgi:hypothetical protein
VSILLYAMAGWQESFAKRLFEVDCRLARAIAIYESP